MHHNHQHKQHQHCDCCEHCSHENEMSSRHIIIATAIFTIGLLANIAPISKFVIFFIAYIIAGKDIILSAFKNILKGEIFDENFLMTIATLGAFSLKEYPEAVMVMILYQIGEYFQHNAVEKSKHSIKSLMNIRPDYANIEKDGFLVKKAPESIEIGETITVKAGEKIPLDGVVIDGNANIDNSALTGESVTQQVFKGSNVLSGSINKNGTLKIRVTKLYKESTVAKILDLVENAKEKKSKAENFITKFAKIYTPIIVFAAILLAVIPPFIFHCGSFSLWYQRALIFLVISCPCALVISIPLTFFAGIGAASKAGILIKGSNYTEALANPDTVIFDKTGTLTKGKFAVSQICPKDIDQQTLLEYCAYAENYSNHPIASAIKQEYKKEIIASKIKDIEELSGYGIKATIEDNKILVGNEKLLEKFEIDYEKNEENGTVIYIAKNRIYIGSIVIKDEIKDTAKTAIESIKPLVKSIVMLTGDNQKAARETAEILNISEYYANLLPADKVTKTESFIDKKDKNKSVIFIGDGINDAPVLMRADVGIAMGALGSDAAIEAADIVIMDDNPYKIFTAIQISKKTINIVKQNIALALGVKLLFLVLGAIGLMTMWGAVFADVGVTLLAVINSLRTLHTKDFIEK